MVHFVALGGVEEVFFSKNWAQRRVFNKLRGGGGGIFEKSVIFNSQQPGTKLFEIAFFFLFSFSLGKLGEWGWWGLNHRDQTP